MLREFDLTTLPFANNKVHAAFRAAIQRCVADCNDRPEDDKARKVVLQLELTPRMEQGCLESVDGKFLIKDTVPVRQSKKINFEVRKRDGKDVLVFNDLSTQNAAQGTLDVMWGDDNPEGGDDGDS